MHRIREAWEEGNPCPFRGPVEVDEANLSGKDYNRHAKDRHDVGRGARDKTSVLGTKDRDSKFC